MYKTRLQFKIEKSLKIYEMNSRMKNSDVKMYETCLYELKKNSKN